jgi:arylsulfatase A-like enzyme
MRVTSRRRSAPFCRVAVLIALAVASGSAASFAASAAETPKADPPNVVFILLDDMGWSDPGCYGNRFYETPNIDGLARKGMRFTNAYAACPVCSPTRASIMTGKYPARVKLTNWIPGGARQTRPLLEPPFQMFLATDEVTIAEALKPAGYATASVGKWHMGGEGHLPEDQGFNLNVAGTEAGSPAGGYFLPNKMNLPGARHGEYLTDRLSIEACKFIRANRDKPFFLYLAHHTVHTPIQGKPELVAKYKLKLKSGEKWNPAYAAMVQSGDESVGRVMATLEESKIADRTVVFFMSDNGGLASVTNNAPLRAGKGHVYEGGIREPMIVVWPGVVAPGSVSNQPVLSVDFYPTILQIAGTQGDAAHNATVDGVSLLPLLKGAGSIERPPLFWHYPHYSPQGGVPAAAVRQGDLKLIEFYEDGHLELYNLADDVGEKSNLADRLPEEAARLHKLLLDWQEQVGAKLPTKNPDFRPAKKP